VGVLILPEQRWRESRVLWQRAEELGFAHAWTYDHITWRGHRDLAWFSAIPTLTAAALATERIRLGTLVASPNFRHPLTLAKEIVTLDDISGGRVTLGIGKGSTGWDATVMAADPLPEDASRGPASRWRSPRADEGACGSPLASPRRGSRPAIERGRSRSTPRKALAMFAIRSISSKKPAPTPRTE
jgi:hypothetical protein